MGAHRILAAEKGEHVLMAQQVEQVRPCIARRFEAHEPGYEVAMSSAVRTLYAIDPGSRRTKLVVQVEPDGWDDEDVEGMLEALVRSVRSSQVCIALAVSMDSCFLIRNDRDTGSCEVDELETSEVLSPHPLHPDPKRLFEVVLAWCEAAAKQDKSFVGMAQLPKRVPTLFASLVGAELTMRDGPADTVAMLNG